jgi:hypothetical protein
MRGCETMGTGSEPGHGNDPKLVSGEVPVPMVSQPLGRLERLWPRARIAFCSLAVWLTAGGAVLAQAPPAQNKPGESVNSGVWVFAYFLAILGIVAGLLFVCRSGGRRDRARPEQYGEAKVVGPEETKK